MSIASRVERGLHLVAGGDTRAAVASPSRSDGERDRSAQPGGGGALALTEGPSVSRLRDCHLSIAAAPQQGESPTLSDLFPASPRDAGWTGFVLARLTPGKPLLWVQERMAILEGGRVHAAGLGGFGDDLIHVEARDARAALWAMEEGLRCPALSGVIGELWGDPQALDFTATRRLAVAAERSGVACWLIRPGGQPSLSGARERWRLASAPSEVHPFDGKAPGAACWEAELFRSRRRAPGRWVEASHVPLPQAEKGSDPPDRLAVVAEPGDRALGGVVRQRT